MEKSKTKKSLSQIVLSSFVIIAGLFVIISLSNNFTARVIGSSGKMNILELIIIIWGGIVLVAGIWMINKKDFHKSVFD